MQNTISTSLTTSPEKESLSPREGLRENVRSKLVQNLRIPEINSQPGDSEATQELTEQVNEQIGNLNNTSSQKNLKTLLKEKLLKKGEGIHLTLTNEMLEQADLSILKGVPIQHLEIEGNSLNEIERTFFGKFQDLRNSFKRTKILTLKNCDNFREGEIIDTFGYKIGLDNLEEIRILSNQHKTDTFTPSFNAFSKLKKVITLPRKRDQEMHGWKSEYVLYEKKAKSRPLSAEEYKQLSS